MYVRGRKEILFLHKQLIFQYVLLYLQVLGVIDNVIEKDLSHFEERRAGQQTIAACLVLWSNSHHLQLKRCEWFTSGQGYIPQSTRNCLQVYLNKKKRFVSHTSRSLASSCKPPFRFLQLFIRNLMSYIQGKNVLSRSKNSSSCAGKGLHVKILRRYPKSYPLSNNQIESY